MLDLKMSGMDGLQLYRQIKKQGTGTVAIIVTAYAASDTAQEAWRAGAFEVLSKPVNFPRLLQLIEDVLERPLVMVVDDDYDFCDTLWDLLHERGYRVCVAHCAAEAEQRLNGRDHKAVMIDLKLQEEDGGDVFRLVREMTPGARTILITGYRDEMNGLVQQVMGEGADAVFYKPLDVDELLTTVKDWVVTANQHGHVRARGRLLRN